MMRSLRCGRHASSDTHAPASLRARISSRAVTPRAGGGGSPSSVSPSAKPGSINDNQLSPSVTPSAKNDAQLDKLLADLSSRVDDGEDDEEEEFEDGEEWVWWRADDAATPPAEEVAMRAHAAAPSPPSIPSGVGAGASRGQMDMDNGSGSGARQRPESLPPPESSSSAAGEPPAPASVASSSSSAERPAPRRPKKALPVISGVSSEQVVAAGAAVATPETAPSGAIKPVKTPRLRRKPGLEAVPPAVAAAEAVAGEAVKLPRRKPGRPPKSASPNMGAPSS